MCFWGLGSPMHNAARLPCPTPEAGDSDAEQVCIYQHGRNLGSPALRAFNFCISPAKVRGEEICTPCLMSDMLLL